MEDSGTLPRPSRLDILSSALGAYLPEINRPAKGGRQGRVQSFQDRLASKHDLTEESARRLVVEYRRYLYLKAVHVGVLTRSKRVDQGWHLHMEGPKLDWNQFCEAQFGTRIEHFTGLSPDGARVGYERTLDLYRQEFGHEPPEDIWPGAAERARAKMAGWMVGLGIVGVFLGVGIGITNSVPIDGSGVEPLETTGGIVAAWLCFGGFGLCVLGSFVEKGTDLEKVAICG